MGGKPRKKPQTKPLTFDDLIQGYDLFKVPGEIWKVTRYLMPEHKTKEFGMAIVGWETKPILRGVNKGGRRCVLTLDYIDKDE